MSIHARGANDPHNAARSTGHYPAHQWQRDYSYDQREVAPADVGRSIVIIVIVLLVLVALIGVGAAIYIPKVNEAREQAIQYVDGDNLRVLGMAYIAGLADQKRAPAAKGVSEGAQWWIALYTSDGAETPSDPFLALGDAGRLVSPRDPYRESLNERLDSQIADAIAAGSGPAIRIDGKLACSYNGPTVATMRAQSTLVGKVIGCTGDRDGWPIFDDGTNLLYGNLKSEFLTWAECASFADAEPPPEYPTVKDFLVPLGLPFALDDVHVVD